MMRIPMALATAAQLRQIAPTVPSMGRLLMRGVVVCRPTRCAAVATAVALLTGFTLTACTVGPDFHAPQVTVPARWQTDAGAALQRGASGSGGASVTGSHATATTTAAAVPVRTSADPVDPQWWRIFNDAELSSLIDRVAGANLDVGVATTRLMQARAALRVTGAAALPSVEGTASYQHARGSQNGLVDISGLDGKHDYNVWQPGLDATWELDLWGRVRRATEAAQASAEAAADLRRDVLLSALAETARDYVELRGVQAEQAITQQNLDIARHGLALTQIRVHDGVATHLDVAEAAAQVAGVEALLPSLEQRRVHLVNALSALLAKPPHALDSELLQAGAIPPMPPVAPLGLPSELAERRPDIRAAQAQWHAATADIGVAIGDLYPRLTLSANIGLQTLHAGDLDEWSSRVFGVGPALSVPIFEGGRLRGRLELRRAQQQEAALHFQQTVLRALHEIDDALTDYAGSQSSGQRLAEAVAQNRIALDNAQRQYVAGTVDYLTVLSVQRNLLATQQALVSKTADVSVSLVRLYKALGGGWETVFPAARALPSGEPDALHRVPSIVLSRSDNHEP